MKILLDKQGSFGYNKQALKRTISSAGRAPDF